MTESCQVPVWTLASAVAAPTVLVASAVSAHLVTTGPYDPLRQTISELAAGGRAEVIITCGIAVSAACQLATATGLWWLRARARAVLALAGFCGLVVAALPVSRALWAMAHVVAAGSGAAMLAVWPLLTISAQPAAPRVCRPLWATVASAVMSTLLIWALYETQRGAMLGLAERIALLTELTWPAIVVFAAHRCFVGASTPIATNNRTLRAPPRATVQNS